LKHPESHPLANKRVRVKSPGILRLSGATEEATYWIEDWQDRVFGFSWMDDAATGNPACIQYAFRSSPLGDDLPTDNDVVYGKINNLGYIIHSSELGEVVGEGRS
jgi:hypothetical protein